jgi:hypothetical protein
MDIIQQVNNIIINEYYQELEEAFQNKSTISEVVLKIQEISNRIGLALLENTLNEVENAIRGSKERKASWHVVRKDDEKTLSTLLGDVTYSRTYYRNKNTREYSYLTDDWFGIKSHERMDLSLKAAVVEKAADLSYEKSIKSFKNIGIHSRTAVMKSIRETGAIDNHAAPFKPGKKIIKTLFIEADEDHVAMQEGDRRIVRIAYVHEGYRNVSKHRNELINARYFTGADINPEDFWRQVSEYIYEAYDMDDVEKVYLSGDGAGWIRAGLDAIPKAEFVLDRYHLSKYVKIATAHLGSFDHDIWHCIDTDQKKEAKAVFKYILEQTPVGTKKKAVREARTYILGNWEAIQRQKSPGYPGCSAEGHVSHILSARLSSRPMGWSLTGADQMARLRVFGTNGGKIYEYLQDKARKEATKRRIERLDRRVVNKARKESMEAVGNIGNITALNIGKKIALRDFLRSVRGL